MVQDSAPNQVRALLEDLIQSGTPGDRLPPVRALMRQLGVSPATVTAAVSELVRTGRVETLPGDGTFIARPPKEAGEAPDRTWQSIALGPSQATDDLLGPLRTLPARNTIDLASGYPDSSLQATALLTKALRDAARRPGGFDRAPSEGLDPLRDWFARQLTPAGEHDVLVAPGGQAALSLSFRSLGLVGDTVLMETPTYVGAVAAARSAGLTAVPVPTDAGGTLVDKLEEAIDRSGASLFYIQPRFHNPTGATLARERRQPLLDLAKRRNLIIIEDDWLHDLDDPLHQQAPLASNDPNGHVIHIRSLTKSVAPALRIAGVASTGAIAQRLRAVRSVEDFFVSPILQEAALGVVTSPGWPRHLKRVRAVLADRQDVLRRGAADLDGLEVARTAGPLHLWLGCRSGVDPDVLSTTALRNGVAIISGTHWHPGDPTASHIRLSNAAATSDQILEGITRLAAALGH